MPGQFCLAQAWLIIKTVQKHVGLERLTHRLNVMKLGIQTILNVKSEQFRLLQITSLLTKKLLMQCRSNVRVIAVPM